MCDNITDEIYRKLERDRSLIYVCKLCRDEVEKIKKECRREVSRAIGHMCGIIPGISTKDGCTNHLGPQPGFPWVQLNPY